MSLNLDLLSKKFGKDFTSYKKIYDGFDNDIFVLINTDGKKYIFRKSLREKPTEDIMFEKNFSDYLYKKNIPVRRVLFTGSESLLDFCEGTSYTPDKLSETMAFNAGQMLAKFHMVSKDFDIPPFPIRKMESELLRVAPIKDKLTNTYTNGEKFVSIVAGLLQSDFLKKSGTRIIHNDFRVQNVLFNGDKISAILDFDWSCFGNPLKDLAHSLVEWSFPDGGTFNPKIFKSFWLGYTSCVQNVDIDELKYWIAFSCISDTATYLCDTIEEATSGGEILSWMYGKYLFFNSQDIAKLTE